LVDTQATSRLYPKKPGLDRATFGERNAGFRDFAPLKTDLFFWTFDMA